MIFWPTVKIQIWGFPVNYPFPCYLLTLSRTDSLHILLIEMYKYLPDIPSVSSVVRDMENMYQFSINAFEIPAGGSKLDIRTLRNKEATHHSIIRATGIQASSDLASKCTYTSSSNLASGEVCHWAAHAFSHSRGGSHWNTLLAVPTRSKFRRRRRTLRHRTFSTRSRTLIVRVGVYLFIAPHWTYANIKRCARAT
jgi:hypothetical protein